MGNSSTNRDQEEIVSTDPGAGGRQAASPAFPYSQSSSIFANRDVPADDNPDGSSQIPSSPQANPEEQSMEEPAVVPKALPDPYQPTKEEVDQHNLTHLPYRSWCRHCVRGRGKSHAKVMHTIIQRPISPT